MAVKQNHADELASGFVRKRLGHQHQAALVLAVATTAVGLGQESVPQAAVEVPSTEEIGSEHALVGPCSVAGRLERGVARAHSVRGFPSQPDADPTEPDSLSEVLPAACTGSTRTDLETADPAARPVHSSSA